MLQQPPLWELSSLSNLQDDWGMIMLWLPLWTQGSLQRGSWLLLTEARSRWHGHLGPQGGRCWLSPAPPASSLCPRRPHGLLVAAIRHFDEPDRQPQAPRKIVIRMLRLLLFNHKCNLPFHVSQLSSHQKPVPLLQFESQRELLSPGDSARLVVILSTSLKWCSWLSLW